jgi:hypothetical protein
MPGYWWECGECHERVSDFKAVCGHKGVPHFIQDSLIQNNWDQNLLVKPCPRCGKNAFHITYEFPKKDKQTLQVLCIVGLVKEKTDYLPMMWESVFFGNGNESRFDFKYIIGRKGFGLNKPAVFSREDLRNLFRLYSNVTDRKEFP